MLGEQVMLFGALGILTSACISFYVSQELKTVILCSLQGAFTGWFAGMMWVYLSGGLDVPLYAIVMPVLVSAFFTYLILRHLPYVRRETVSKELSSLATLGLFVLAFFVAFSSLPLAYQSTLNTQTFSVSALDWGDSQTIVNTLDAPGYSYEIPIQIESTKSSIISFGVLSENPNPHSTLDFKVFFSPEIDWIQPYLKIGVYEDKLTIQIGVQICSGKMIFQNITFIQIMVIYYRYFMQRKSLNTRMKPIKIS